jgi:type VI secretion system protein ImpG
MKDLLPFYERDLSYLRHYSRRFSQRYPKIAGGLLPDGEYGQDPHVERLVQAVALLNARIGKKLDDDYPEFLDALFDVLYPHYLRPFPACSIGRFDVKHAERAAYRRIFPRGTELISRSIGGVECRFRTLYDVTLAPVAIYKASYLPAASAPIALPGNAAGAVSIMFESTALGLDLRSLGLRTIRVHLNGERSLVAALTDGLLAHALTTYVEADADGRWLPLRTAPIAQAGFTEAGALLDYPMLSHPAYRLLFEYFGFPEKFDFIDVDLGALLDAAGSCRRLTLHVVLGAADGGRPAAPELALLSAAHFQLFATPVVNLFRQRGEPIRMTHAAVAYPVVANARNASAYEVYSVDSVRLIRQAAERDEVSQLRPFFSLRFGEEDRLGRYWFVRRDKTIEQKSPGYETEISVIDADFDPSACQTETLSLELSCTNRNLPSKLAVGLTGGDLFVPDGAVDSGGAAVEIALLRRPTRSLRFKRDDDLQVRLLSHLSLNHLSLADMDATVLKALLTLYDVRRTAASSRLVDAVVGIELRDAVAELPGNPFPTSVQGIELRLTLDERHFVGTSMATFVGVMNAFLGNYVELNSFVQLTVLSGATGREMMRCPPLSGESVLA